MKEVTSEFIKTVDITRRPGPHQEEDPAISAWRERVKKFEEKKLSEVNLPTNT